MTQLRVCDSSDNAPYIIGTAHLLPELCSKSLTHMKYFFFNESFGQQKTILPTACTSVPLYSALLILVKCAIYLKTVVVKQQGYR